MLIAPRPAWTYLFRSDASFEAAAPADSDLIRGAPSDGRRRVVVHAGEAKAALARANELWGAALFGPGDLTERDLVRAGFAYVRRFAVFPTPARPRWFVPMGRPGLARAALRVLATPYRPRGRALAALASVALRAAGPLLRGAELWIASRESPPLETELARILGHDPAAIGLASGGWGLRHTPTVVALAADGQPLAYAKLAGSERSRRLVTHEAEVLAALGRRPEIGDVIPRVLFAGPIDGVFANVQTPLIGRPGPARMSPAHMRFLAALGGGEPRDAAASTLLRSLPERMAEKRIGSLTQIATRAIEALRGAAFVPTVVHGDFAPFNLRMEGGVLRAFDWENAWLDGLPLLDAIHHELQVGFLLQDWDIRSAIRALDRLAVERARDGLSRTRVRALQAIYLLDMYLRRLDGGHGEESPLTLKYRELLRHLDADLVA